MIIVPYLTYTFPHLYKGWGNVIFELGSERVKPDAEVDWWAIQRK